jgi:hypothetical protein
VYVRKLDVSNYIVNASVRVRHVDKSAVAVIATTLAQTRRQWMRFDSPEKKGPKMWEAGLIATARRQNARKNTASALMLEFHAQLSADATIVLTIYDRLGWRA